MTDDHGHILIHCGSPADPKWRLGVFMCSHVLQNPDLHFENHADEKDPDYGWSLCDDCRATYEYIKAEKPWVNVEYVLPLHLHCIECRNKHLKQRKRS